VKVLDFGISKMMPPPGGVDSGLTHSSAVMGSPNYMSPEQLASTRDVDTRTDVYALGAILYHLLAARPPFVAESFAELCSLVLNATPDPLRSLNPKVPEALEKAVLGALQKHLGKRLPTVAVLAQKIVPFGPAHARISAERIGRVLRTAGIGVTAVALPSPELPRRDGETMDGLGQTVSGKRTSALWAAALAVTALGGGALALTLIRGAADPAPSASESGNAAAPPPLPAVTASAGPAALTTSVEQEPIVTPSPAAANAAPLVIPQGEMPPPKPPPATAPPPPAAATAPLAASARPALPKPAGKKDCDPAYYFDKDGHKHFKPECF
jgi:serine/threonine-protein kinase